MSAPPAALDARVGVDRLLRPRGIIVVGASADPDKLGGAMATSLATYDGSVGLVNAR